MSLWYDVSALITLDSYNIVGNLVNTGCLSDIAYHRNVYEIKWVKIDKLNEQRNDIYFLVLMCIQNNSIYFWQQKIWISKYKYSKEESF